MRFFETSKIYSLNRIQYIRLRWIAIIGQLITINFVKYGLGFEFNHILSNFIIYLGAISNLVLIYYYKKIKFLTDLLLFFYVWIFSN